jgi:hypothetical protein
MTELFEEELQGGFMDESEAPGNEVPGEEYDEPDGDFVQNAVRPIIARKYEKKIKTGLNTLFREAVAHEKTVPDAAAIIMYGPRFAEKWGLLANHDKRVRRGIDMFLEGTENPYLAAVLATTPLLLQVWRNHEDELSPKGAITAMKESRKKAKEREPRKIKIPFTKRHIEFRWRLNLPSARNLTNDPKALSQYVFSRQDIIEAMQKAGIVTFAGAEFNGAGKQPGT